MSELDALLANQGSASNKVSMQHKVFIIYFIELINISSSEEIQRCCFKRNRYDPEQGEAQGLGSLHQDE